MMTPHSVHALKVFLVHDSIQPYTNLNQFRLRKTLENLEVDGNSNHEISSSDEDRYNHNSSNLHLKTRSKSRPEVPKINVFLKIVKKIGRSTSSPFVKKKNCYL